MTKLNWPDILAKFEVPCMCAALHCNCLLEQHIYQLYMLLLRAPCSTAVYQIYISDMHGRS